MASIYLIGSLRNPKVPEVAKVLRANGYDVFDDWYSVGPECDEKWQEYEKSRGRTFSEALAGYHAKDVFDFDKTHLDRCAVGVMVAPTGKSGHLEMGYMVGSKKPMFVLLDGEPDRFDIMYLFATAIVSSVDELVKRIRPDAL